MPSVRPRISWLPFADLSQTPACSARSRSFSRRRAHAAWVGPGTTPPATICSGARAPFTATSCPRSLRPADIPEETYAELATEARRRWPTPVGGRHRRQHRPTRRHRHPDQRVPARPARCWPAGPGRGRRARAHPDDRQGPRCIAGRRASARRGSGTGQGGPRARRPPRLPAAAAGTGSGPRTVRAVVQPIVRRPLTRASTPAPPRTLRADPDSGGPAVGEAARSDASSTGRAGGEARGGVGC